MSSSRARPCAVLALIATAAAGLLLSGCGTTEGLFSLKSLPEENVQMSASQAVTATQEWAAAYAKNPEDPRNVIGYARTLKALGSDDKALEILKTAFQASPTNGDIAAELGRLALETDHLEIAKPALELADQQGVHDWSTLSALGTLRAKEGQHDQAQRYYLAALENQPDALSVINNLALSYMLDGKAQNAEELLRKAVSAAMTRNGSGKTSRLRWVCKANLPGAAVRFGRHERCGCEGQWLLAQHGIELDELVPPNPSHLMTMRPRLTSGSRLRRTAPATSSAPNGRRQARTDGQG